MSRVWTDPRLLFWSLLEAAASPALLALKLKRHFLQDYEWEFEPRRWRIPNLSPDVPPARIVFVGAGPGELVMIDRLIETIETRRPSLPLGVCLRNLDTLTQLRKDRPSQRLSVWPFDALPPVARWLAQEQPEVVVFVDRFRFTTFACGAARFGAKLALVNGRSRPRRSAFYHLAAPFYRWQMGGFRLMAMLSQENADWSRPLASPECTIIDTGSLKADLRVREMVPEARADLERWLKPDDLPILAVGSTTEPEEEAMVLDAFLAVREKRPCRLLLAPRDIRRIGSTHELLAARRIKASHRSLDEGPSDVLLLDTFGELATAYASCRAAYVGGFRGKGGGHNVLEPLEHGVPVAYGPNSGNFAAERRLAQDAGAGRTVDNAEELAAFWLRCLTDEAECARLGAAGKAVLQANRGAFERTADAILALVE